MASACELLWPKQRRASLLVGIFPLHLRALNLCITRAFVPYLLPWLKLLWRPPRIPLSRGTVLPRAGKGLATEGMRGMSSGPRMPVDIRLSIQKISSACGRKVDTYPLPLTRTCSALLFCSWGFVLLLHSLRVPSLLILSGLGLIPLCKTMKPRNFLAVTPKAHLLGLSFMLWEEGCRTFPWDPPSDLPPFSFSLACRQRRPGHFSQFAARTFCSWTSDMLRPHFLDRMALLYSKRGLG